MQEGIGDDERPSHAPQVVTSLRAAAAAGRLPCRSWSTYFMNSAIVVAPCIRPAGARSATHDTYQDGLLTWSPRVETGGSPRA